MTYLKEMAEQGYIPEKTGRFHEFMVPWLMSSQHVEKDECIVDVGAGQGHCLIPLHLEGWRQLVAVDVDDFNFPIFKRKYGIICLLCDVESHQLNLETGSVGAILCFHLIEHLTNPDNFLREAHRILKPEGKLFLVTPDWRKQYKTFWRDPKHVHPYDKTSIARLLRIHRFIPIVSSWNSRYGLGRIHAYRRIPRLGMIGKDVLAIGTKSDLR